MKRDDGATGAESAAVRVSFVCRGPLSPETMHQLTGEIRGGLPVAPGEVELDLRGGGAVLCREEDEVTLEELTEAVIWLRSHPRLTDVSWQYVVDL